MQHITVSYLISIQRTNIRESKTIGKLSEVHLEKILENVRYENEEQPCNGCWIWTGRCHDYLERKGHQHASMSFNKSNRFVHRLMYHNFIENVPEYEHKSGALQVNHKCNHEHNGRCMNPWHRYSQRQYARCTS